MKTGLVPGLAENSEAHAQHKEGGIDDWPARVRQRLPAYSQRETDDNKPTR